MDRSLGALVSAFDARTNGTGAVIVLADHGESLGEHGESEHGNLLYQSVMHVPLVIAGGAIPPGVVERPVSARRVFHTILDLANIDAGGSLRNAPSEAVVAEAMHGRTRAAKAP